LYHKQTGERCRLYRNYHIGIRKDAVVLLIVNEGKSIEGSCVSGQFSVSNRNILILPQLSRHTSHVFIPAQFKKSPSKNDSFLFYIDTIVTLVYITRYELIFSCVSTTQITELILLF